MRFLSLIAVLLCGLTSWAGPLRVPERKEIALHIAVIDHMAFSTAAFEEVNEFVRESLPSKELRSVSVETSILRGREPEVRASLIKQIHLEEGDRVSHLIIDTHGSSTVDSTSLSYLGDFGANGMDLDLTELLSPLRGHLAPDVVVVLNSCSTVCGTTSEAAARVAGLLKSLGATNAQVYGSIVSEVESPGSLVDRWRIRDYFGDESQLKLFITLGFALGVPLNVLEAVSQGHALSFVGLSSTVAAISASLYALATTMKIALARFGAVNLGRLFVFRGGRLVRVTEVAKYPARLEIYGTCPALFDSGR